MSNTNSKPNGKKSGNALAMVAMLMSFITVGLAIWALVVACGNRPPPPRTDVLSTLTSPMDFDAKAREATRDFVAKQVEYQTSAAQANMGTFASMVMTSVAILIAVSLAVLGFTWWRQSREYDTIVKQAEEAAEQTRIHAEQAEANFKDKLAEINARAEQFFKDLAKKKNASLKEIGTASEVYKLFLQAFTAFEKKNFDEAIELYTKAIKLKPNDVEAYLNLAEAFIARRRFGDAATCLEQGLQNIPKMTDRDRLAAVYLKAMAMILDGKSAAKAEAEVNRMLAAGVRLTGWDFKPANRFFTAARAKDFPGGTLTKARALHKRVKEGRSTRTRKKKRTASPKTKKGSRRRTR